MKTQRKKTCFVFHDHHQDFTLVTAVEAKAVRLHCGRWLMMMMMMMSVKNDNTTLSSTQLPLFISEPLKLRFGHSGGFALQGPHAAHWSL